MNRKIIVGLDGKRIALLDGDNTIGQAIERCGLFMDVSGSVQRCPRSVRPGSIAIDVGAYIGDTANVLLDLDYASVFAFEPMRDAFECLEWNIWHRSMAVFAFNSCVGNGESIKLEFENHFQMHTNYGARWVTELPSGQEGHKAVRLDDVFHESDVELIKIDVEGRESAVLLGAQKIIERCRPHIHIEVNRPTLERQGDTPEKLLALLSDAGYKNGIETYRCSENQWDMLFRGGK